MLYIKNISKKYINKHKSSTKKELSITILNCISFEVTNGLFGLLGPNGAGKSTLINIVTGGLKQSSGLILWNGVNINRLGKKYRKILGYMPQQQNLYDSFTGRQFLTYMCALKEIPKNSISLEVEQVAKNVNLSDHLDKKLKAYSGGMKQRLLAATAIIGQPKLIIFDEPTAGLDPKERVRLRELMKELSKNAIVITATHVVSDVETVADEILLLKDGHLIDKAPVDVLIDKYAPGQNLEQVYLNIFGEEGVH